MKIITDKDIPILLDILNGYTQSGKFVFETYELIESFQKSKPSVSHTNPNISWNSRFGRDLKVCQRKGLLPISETKPKKLRFVNMIRTTNSEWKINKR